MNRRFTTSHIITAADLPEQYRLLTRAEAAQLFQRSQSTLSAWVGDGRLPVVRIGRRVQIRLSTFRDYLDALNPHTAQPEPDNLATVIDRYLTINGTAELLGIHRNTVSLLIRDGGLASVPFGRNRYVPVRALTDLIDSCTTPATTGPLAGLPV